MNAILLAAGYGTRLRPVTDSTPKCLVKIKNEPYVIKNYAKEWYAYKNWSFDYLKNLDSNLSVNTITGSYSEKIEITPCKLKDYIEKVISNKTTAYLSLFHLFKAFPDLKKHIEYQDIKN